MGQDDGLGVHVGDMDSTEDHGDDHPIVIGDSGDVRLRSERVRGRTISVKRLSKRDLERWRLLNPSPEDDDRPMMREHCEDHERPCPYVSCKHHLYLDVNHRTGSIKMNFPDMEVWDLADTCALDVADRGGVTLEEVGEIMNLTRERIRQVETRALAKIKALNLSGLSDYLGE